MPESVDRKKLTYYVGMDFAISEDQRRDYTVIVVAGMDTDGMLYVVDVQRGIGKTATRSSTRCS